LEVTAVEHSTGLSKVVSMDTKNIKPHLNLEEAQKNIASLIATAEESEEYGDDTESNIADLKVIDTDDVRKQEILNRAKDLRKRAEALLNTVNSEDVEEIRDLLTKNLKAVNENDIDNLSDTNESLEDMIFYLDD
jgi:uncharacterized protein YaaN involved in tellurite resistance